MPWHYTVKLCIALQNPGFTGFLAKGLKKPNFDDCSKRNNKSLIRWFNMYIIIIHTDILLLARIFPRPFGGQKNTTQLTKYPCVLYVKPSNKMYVSALSEHELIFFVTTKKSLI